MSRNQRVAHSTLCTRPERHIHNAVTSVAGVVALANHCQGIRVLHIAHCAKLERRTYSAVAAALGQVLVRQCPCKLVCSHTVLLVLGHVPVRQCPNKKNLVELYSHCTAGIGLRTDETVSL